VVHIVTTGVYRARADRSFMPLTAVSAPVVVRMVMLKSAAVMERLNKMCARVFNASETEASRQSADNYTYSVLIKLMFHTLAKINNLVQF
jgi:hypothetical protein